MCVCVCARAYILIYIYNPQLLTFQPRGDISCEVNFKRL